MRIGVCDASSGEIPAGICEGLLLDLDQYHLRDSTFHSARWLSHDHGEVWARMVAHHAGTPLGFLGGRPATGHIAIVGSVNPGHGVGPALLDAFAERSRRAGATTLTVTIDTETSQRWRRRRFFERYGFTPVAGSALHFAKSNTRPATTGPFDQHRHSG